MAKLYTGTYGAGTTAENALNTALLQYPEIGRTIISQYPRYAATYLLERTGRYATEKVLGDNSFEWKVMGRYNAPSYSTGFVLGVSADTSWTSSPTASSGAWTAADAVNDQFSILMDGTGGSPTRTPDFLNKWDMVRFQSGATAIVIEDPRSNDSGSGASTDRIVKFEIVDASAQAVQTSDVADEAIIASIGSAFPNGSDGADVGENWMYPSTHQNWLTTMRKKCSVTGKDLTDVTWIENNGSKLWYFTREQQMMD